LGEGFSLQGRLGLDVVVEAFNGYFALFILHCCQEVGERPEWVRGDAAPVSGVQVAIGSPRLQLETQHAPHTEEDL
jgi:hypothetical protein